MQWRVRAACAAAGAAAAVVPVARAAPVADVLRNSGFETGARTWALTGPASARLTAERPHHGRRALAVEATAGHAVAVSFGTQGPLLRRLTFLSPVTGALRGTFDATVWVRGSHSAAGKLVRVELDEFGGATAEGALPGAVAAARLGSHWQRVSVHGSVERPDRIGVALTVGLDDAARGDTLLVDDARIGGDPLGAVTITRTGRWHWWAYALVWAIVLAGGAAWLVVPLRRAKTARAPLP